MKTTQLFLPVRQFNIFWSLILDAVNSLFEDLSLIDRLSTEISFPQQVLIYHLLMVSILYVQLGELVRWCVNVPIVRQLQRIITTAVLMKNAPSATGLQEALCQHGDRQMGASNELSWRTVCKRYVNKLH